ncbi:unnamed protein product, partial [Phaeothamnion confervicola]
GGSVALVTAVQARNNARLVVAGSLAMFSDQFVHAAGVGNAVFCTEVSQWALRERGMQRASDVAHSRTDGTVAELLLHQKDRRDLPFSLFSEPEIAKHSQVRQSIVRFWPAVGCQASTRRRGFVGFPQGERLTSPLHALLPPSTEWNGCPTLALGAGHCWAAARCGTAGTGGWVTRCCGSRRRCRCDRLNTTSTSASLGLPTLTTPAPSAWCSASSPLAASDVVAR